MITIRKAGYTVKNLIDLRDILVDGYNKLSPTEYADCEHDCTPCYNYWLCKDLDATIKYLNAEIAKREAFMKGGLKRINK